MASACVNNSISMSPEKFLPCPSYGWLSPRISISRDCAHDSAPGDVKPTAPEKKAEVVDPVKDVGDFEFRLDDPVTMLPADELFSDGKLLPLQISAVRKPEPEVRSPEKMNPRRRSDVSNDPYLFSPKAPRCSSRWREILGLKKINKQQEIVRTTSSSFASSSSSKSIRHLLQRHSKTASYGASDSSLNLPLLKDTDSESVSISSRHSLSSSSSGHDHDDLPRLSLDSDKPNKIATGPGPSLNQNQPRVRMVRPRMVPEVTGRAGRSPGRKVQREPGTVSRGVSVDSPRMNSSGKVVFQSLERSSSSPSSYGGPRYKHRGMERSYSANVRVTPVLNVPVCSLRGSSKSGVFGLFSSSSSQSHKKDINGVGSSNGSTKNGHHHHHNHSSTSKGRRESTGS